MSKQPPPAVASRSTPHAPHHSQKWCSITKYRRALPKEAYRSLRYFETCAVVDFAGGKGYKIVTISENCIHFLNNGSTKVDPDAVIYYSDIVGIGCVNEASDLFGDTETNLNSQLITISMRNSKKHCDIHTIEERTKLMFHVHAAWRTYCDRKAMGLGIAISTGSDHGRYNRRLYEEIEAEILTIDPQESLLEMQRSSDLIYELSKAIIHDRTIKQCFFESMALIYWLLQQISICHATNLVKFNRVSQLKYAMALMTLLQSALFNSQTIDARLNLCDPSPFTFTGLIEILTTDFRPASAFMAENKYIKAKHKYEKKIAKRKMKETRQNLMHQDRVHGSAMISPTRTSKLMRKSMNNSKQSKHHHKHHHKHSKHSHSNHSNHSNGFGSQMKHNNGKYNGHNSDNSGNDGHSDDMDSNSDQYDDSHSNHDDYEDEEDVVPSSTIQNRHRLLGPSAVLSTSHRRSPTKHKIWSHMPATVDEEETNHVHHHHGRYVENAAHHIHASSSDSDSEDDNDNNYDQQEEENHYNNGGGILAQIRHAYNDNTLLNRHAYDSDEDHHLHTKPLSEGGIVLLKSSLAPTALKHVAQRVASKEATLYAKEHHRVPMMEHETHDEYESKIENEYVPTATPRSGYAHDSNAAHHSRHEHDHLSDHEGEWHADTEEEHDLDIVTTHVFGEEHDRLLHELNVLQCKVLVCLDSVTQHASLHEHAGTLQSLPMAVNNIPAFTSTRIVDYLRTLVWLVRDADDIHEITLSWQLSSVMKVIHIFSTGSHHLRR